MKKSVYLQIALVFCFILCSVGANASIPGVTIPPANVTTCQGDTAIFTVADTGSLPITYLWQISTDGGTTWTTLKDTLFFGGSLTDTLLVYADSFINNSLYRSIATNADGADTSTSALLVVNQLPDPGAITGGTSVCKGSSITLSDDSTHGAWTSSDAAIATVGSSSGIVTGIKQGAATISYTVTNTCGATVLTSGIRVDTSVTAAPITGPTSLCKAGAPINLMNANVSGSWAWSVSNGDAVISHSGVVTGVTKGTAVISYVFTNACVTDTSTLVITVDSTLNHGSISGGSTVCTGSWIHLTETVGGGVWISGNTGVAVVDGAGNVTGVSQGTSVISYYLSNACGASIATDTFSVISPATTITGGDSVGVHNTIALMDSATGGMWASSDTAIATIDTFTGVATGVAAGVTTISYTVTNICGTSTSVLTLNVGTAPNPGVIYGTTDSAVCVGASITLLDSATGGTGVWSSTNDSIATVDASSGVVTGVHTILDTIYNMHYAIDTIVYTYTNAFGTSQTMIPIVVNQIPVVTVSGPAIVALAGNYFFIGKPYYDWTRTPSFLVAPNPANTNNGTWTHTNSSMGAFVSFLPEDGLGLHLASVASYVVVNAGTDVITYTVTNVCGSISIKDTISLNAVLPGGVKPVSAAGNGFNVYPNPTTDGAFTINLESAATEDAQVTVTDVTGQKVSEMTITTNKSYSIRLEQPAGLYLLSATTATGKYDTKVTIVK